MYQLSIVLLSALTWGSIVAKKRADWQKDVDDHNKKNKEWKSALSPDIDYENEAVLKAMANLKKDPTHAPKGDLQINNNDNTSSRLLQTVTLPAKLDLRVKYPKCWSIGHIRNQGQCGSCWAVSAMASLSDRYCISYSNSTTTVQRSLSYQDPLECCTTCGFASRGGCDGGYLHSAFEFAKNVGVVEGENHGNMTLCKPYFLSSSAPSAIAPACQKNCTNGTNSTTFYNANKKYLVSYVLNDAWHYSYNVAKMITLMKTALVLRGSIIAAIDVYDCFYRYSSGIYSRTGTIYIGGHAMKVIGYNDNSNGRYWIVANSWGTGWGMKGFIWIKMATSGVYIEYLSAEGNFK